MSKDQLEHAKRTSRLAALRDELHAAILKSSHTPPDDHGIQWVTLRLPLEYVQLLFDGVVLAELGDKDPFRLRWRGRPPALSLPLQTRAVEIFEYFRQRLNMSHDEALECVAREFGVTEKTVANIIKDNPDAANWARKLYSRGKK